MTLASVATFIEALGALAPAIWLRESATAYLLVNAWHIASLGLGVGSALLMDLHLCGMIGRQVAMSALAPFLSRAAATGLGLAGISGAWLFLVRPAEYLENPAFLIKLALIGMAVVNLSVLHGRGGWKAALSRGKASALTRVQALASMLLWLAALVAGRWIGFL